MGIVGETMPVYVRSAARRTAGRSLKNAIDSKDVKQLKGALVAAQRLQAADVPEFSQAASLYKKLSQLPEGWDIGRMVGERKLGSASLLSKPDVSNDNTLRSLVQL